MIRSLVVVWRTPSPSSPSPSSNNLEADVESVELSESEESDVIAEIGMQWLPDPYAPCDRLGEKAWHGPSGEEKVAYLRKQHTKVTSMITLMEKVLPGWAMPRDAPLSNPRVYCARWLGEAKHLESYLEEQVQLTQIEPRYEFDRTLVHERMINIVVRFNNLRYDIEPIINERCSVDVAPRVLGDLVKIFKRPRP